MYQECFVDVVAVVVMVVVVAVVDVVVVITGVVYVVPLFAQPLLSHGCLQIPSIDLDLVVFNVFIVHVVGPRRVPKATLFGKGYITSIAQVVV